MNFIGSFLFHVEDEREDSLDPLLDDLVVLRVGPDELGQRIRDLEKEVLGAGYNLANGTGCTDLYAEYQ